MVRSPGWRAGRQNVVWYAKPCVDVKGDKLLDRWVDVALDQFLGAGQPLPFGETHARAYQFLETKAARIPGHGAANLLAPSSCEASPSEMCPGNAVEKERAVSHPNARSRLAEGITGVTL